MLRPRLNNNDDYNDDDDDDSDNGSNDDDDNNNWLAPHQETVLCTACSLSLTRPTNKQLGMLAGRYNNFG